MFIGPCVFVIVEEWKTNLMSLAILFHFLCAQYVSDINMSIFRSLWLCCWITTSVVLFSVRCVLEIWCGWFWVVLVLQAEACNTSTTQNQKHFKVFVLSSRIIQWVQKTWHLSVRPIKFRVFGFMIDQPHDEINCAIRKNKEGWEKAKSLVKLPREI